MDQRFIDLFDTYTHGRMRRREFLDRLASLAGGAAAATALLPMLENDYAHAQIVPETDSRVVTETVTFPSTMGGVTGYLARPAGEGKHGGVVVIHENRGLNPHIKDVTRRLATDGFVALAPDYLSHGGGTPADEDQARELISQLMGPDALAISKAAVEALRARPDVNGKVGAVGFCWGGGQANILAVSEPALAAAVSYYGRQPTRAQVDSIKAPLLLHYAGLDDRINAGISDFEAALKDEGKTYELFMYEGANHAFNNDTNAARYDKAASDLAWGRTVEFLRKHLA